MKTAADKKRLQLFIGSLAVVAFFINHLFVRPEIRLPQPSQPTAYSQPVQQQVNSQPVQQQLELERAKAERLRLEQEAARKAQDEAAARHAAELARYLDVRIARKPGMRSVAVAVASEDGKLNRPVATALAGLFKSEGIETSTALFAPEFISDNLFTETFGGSRAAFTRLDLADSLDAVVLARQTVEYSQNAALENVLSAHMRLDITTMPVSRRGDVQTWTFTANGAGFKRDDARKQAEERLLKQLADHSPIALDSTATVNR